MTATLPTTTSEPIATHVETLNRDGITALKGAFSLEWADAITQGRVRVSGIRADLSAHLPL